MLGIKHKQKWFQLHIQDNYDLMQEVHVKQLCIKLMQMIMQEINAKW